MKKKEIKKKEINQTTTKYFTDAGDVTIDRETGHVEFDLKGANRPTRVKGTAGRKKKPVTLSRYCTIVRESGKNRIQCIADDLKVDIDLNTSEVTVTVNG